MNAVNPSAIAPSLDTAALKDAMSRFTTGVTVVTTQFEGHDYGMTCNSFNTVSLDPPMVMWCIRNTSASFSAYTQGAGYVVNVLASSQQHLAMKFTQGSQDERFAGVTTHNTPSGMKRVDGAVAWFDCSLEKTVSAGDHTILIGRVNAVGTQDVAGLAYARRQFGVLSSA
jgi:3-hydroxy-9,10-secoandrosta-1,3,5(10)-triene-9,17-dione monooxygenase reductase component